MTDLVVLRERVRAFQTSQLPWRAVEQLSEASSVAQSQRRCTLLRDHQAYLPTMAVFRHDQHPVSAWVGEGLVIS